ncbi:MAG TPA: hypothetical protein VFU57_13625 [Candidatus Acidoferrales bacterium]|nr:hypothetical protein [Candidatus Acidoferrales bacterium]
MRRLPFSISILLFAFLSIPAFAQTIPANTNLLVRLDDSVSSQSAKRNQRVKASVAKDLTINGDVLVPKGAPAAVFVSSVHAGGDASKPAVLTLRLDAVTVGGRAYPISADHVGEKSVSVKPPKNQGVAGSVGTPVKGQATNQRTASSGGAAAGNANADIISSEGTAEVSYPADTVLSFRLLSPVHVK